jgi:hypothetical protein
MASSSLTETKTYLVYVNHQLQLAEAGLQDATPTHTNDIDAWLSTGIKEAEDDLSNLIEKVRAIITQIG